MPKVITAYHSSRLNKWQSFSRFKLYAESRSVPHSQASHPDETAHASPSSRIMISHDRVDRHLQSNVKQNKSIMCTSLGLRGLPELSLSSMFLMIISLVEVSQRRWFFQDASEIMDFRHSSSLRPAATQFYAAKLRSKCYQLLIVTTDICR